MQAVLNIYETFHRSDGRTLKLPMDQGEGQHWNRKPGNLYSEPAKIHFDPAAAATIRIELTRPFPPSSPRRHEVHQARPHAEQTAQRFLGTPDVPGRRGAPARRLRRTPRRALSGDVLRRATSRHLQRLPHRPQAAGRGGRRRARERGIDYAYKLYQDWTSGRLPHMLIVTTQDANPFYDDSYAVNSANLGPYGDALTQELYPYVEKQFRAIGEPWARILYGGSTGGWRALAQQVLYPDFFNGAWVSCPDPIDFNAYALVNLYKDDNAFFAKSQWKRVPIPMQRTTDGRITSDMDDAIRFELVLGTHGRSAEQFDIWQAVYSPVGEDGYPALIIDPRTGAIDHKVAEYWKEHYDLNYIMQRDWKTLGPKLVGKLHFAVGEADTYYLERAVHLTEQFLESTREPGKGPYSGATFDYGAGPAAWLHRRHLPARAVAQRHHAPAADAGDAGAHAQDRPACADTRSWRLLKKSVRTGETVCATKASAGPIAAWLPVPPSGRRARGSRPRRPAGWRSRLAGAGRRRPPRASAFRRGSLPAPARLPGCALPSAPTRALPGRRASSWRRTARRRRRGLLLRPASAARDLGLLPLPVVGEELRAARPSRPSTAVETRSSR